jgi:hypothetical protein
MQGELEHCKVKRRYPHTNKQQFVDQLVNIDTIETVHKRMNNELAMAEGNVPATQHEYGDEDRIESGEINAETLGQAISKIKSD